MCLVTLYTSVGHLGDVEGVLGGVKQRVVLGDLGSWGPPLDIPIYFISIFINFLCILFNFFTTCTPVGPLPGPAGIFKILNIRAKP